MISPITLEKATLYEKYRLPYAREAIDELLEHIDEIQIVADIGAGTGQLARLFADRSTKIYAIEPDPAMRQVASASLQGFTNIKVIDGCAEQTNLAPNSIDLIVVGNAFHRFKPEACIEFRRILKKSGWAALVNYTFTNKAFTDMLFSKLGAVKGLSGRVKKAWHSTPLQNLFGDGHIHTLNYRQSYTED